MNNSVSLIISGNYFFSFAAICFIVLFIIFLVINDHGYKPTKKMLVKTAVIALAGCIIEVIAMIIGQVNGIPVIIKEILFSANLISMFMCAYYFNRYTFAYITRHRDEIRVISSINNAIAVVFVIIVIAGLKFHYMFEFTENGVSYRPMGIMAGYAAPLYYVLIGLVWIFHARSDLTRREFSALLATHVCIITGTVLQGISGDKVLLVCFAIAMGLFIIYSFLEAPDYHKMLEANKRLYEAERRASAANKAKSAFLLTMSREIRTPMNGVLGMNEMIKLTLTDNKLDQDTRIDRSLEYSENIRRAGDGLIKVINDILDISKLESGELEIVKKPYHFKSLIDELFDSLVFQADTKGLAFSMNIDRNLPGYVNGDRLRVGQVISNIANNAIKYTNNGSVSIDVTGESEGNTVVYRIEVKDTGIGIRPEDMPYLFDPYDRADNDDTHYREGTGLGLSIVRSLLDMMDGDIKADSTYGKGSAFTVTIPQEILSDERIFDHAKLSDKDEIQDSKYSIKGRKILIVDDNKTNIAIARHFLMQMEAETDTALSGREALMLIETVHYDLIFMDQMMPEMCGDEVLKHIKEDYVRYRINYKTPVVVLTANAISGEENKFTTEYGFTDCLTKPFKFEDMVEMVSRYVTS